MFRDFGTPEQQDIFINGMLAGTHRVAFGLTEPDHGSDATWMETRAEPCERDGVDGWLINGEKMWNTGLHVANYDMIFARTSGDDGAARGISCFLVPTDAPGFKIEEYLWTFNMPTDHPRISLTECGCRIRHCLVRAMEVWCWRNILCMKPYSPSRIRCRRSAILHQ
ncbi:MAG: hypothetical protein CM15mP55_3010 [Hyphomicrobiales bacterium]|nr:MAG: hypothetical protein CM15mP55_3010 [Hyphomicrobiales bacterium]